jgi:sarcosine oxidase subunit beta
MAVPPEGEAALRENVRLQRSVGIETELLSVDDLQQLMPDLDTAGLALAAYEPRSGYADAHATTMSYSRQAERLGARVRTGVEVAEIRAAGGRAAGVTTSTGERIDAGQILLAAGPWSAPLARLCGVELPVRPHRVQVGLFTAAPEFTPRHVFVDTALGVYQRPESPTTLLVGSVETAEADPDIGGPDDYVTAADAERMDLYAERLLGRVPVMQDGQYHSGYASLYDVTPDWMPIVDAVPGTSGLFCVAGSSGHGFKLAPMVAAMAADLVMGARDVEPLFAFDRFGVENASSGGYPDHDILG